MPEPTSPAKRYAFNAVHSWQMAAFVTSLFARIILADRLSARGACECPGTSLQTPTALLLSEAVLGREAIEEVSQSCVVLGNPAN